MKNALTLALTGLLQGEDFSDCPPGNLPVQSYSGTGFKSNRAWIGLDSSFSPGVSDAGVVSCPGLTSSLVASAGGKATVKGDGSNLEIRLRRASVLPAEVTMSAGSISVQGANFLSDKSFNLTFSGPIAQAYTIRAATNLALPFPAWSAYRQETGVEH